jgi:Trk K+ transport system NAD-binding subunit
MEKDPRRARQVADEIGSIVLNRDGCEGQHLDEAGAKRAAIVAAVTGDDEDNLVVCQMAKHHFDVPRTIARVNNPRNEVLFRHLGVDEIISPTRMALAAIEQDIPVHELLHLAQLQGGDLELLEAQIGPDSPAIGMRPSDITLRGSIAGSSGRALPSATRRPGPAGLPASVATPRSRPGGTARPSGSGAAPSENPSGSNSLRRPRLPWLPRR